MHSKQIYFWPDLPSRGQNRISKCMSETMVWHCTFLSFALCESSNRATSFFFSFFRKWLLLLLLAIHPCVSRHSSMQLWSFSCNSEERCHSLSVSECVCEREKKIRANCPKWEEAHVTDISETSAFCISDDLIIINETNLIPARKDFVTFNYIVQREFFPSFTISACRLDYYYFIPSYKTAV